MLRCKSKLGRLLDLEVVTWLLLFQCPLSWLVPLKIVRILRFSGFVGSYLGLSLFNFRSKFDRCFNLGSALGPRLKSALQPSHNISLMKSPLGG